MGAISCKAVLAIIAAAPTTLTIIMPSIFCTFRCGATHRHVSLIWHILCLRTAGQNTLHDSVHVIAADKHKADLASVQALASYACELP